MSPILLDTNAYAAFKRGQAAAVDVMQRAPSIGVNSIVLGELLGGFAAGTRVQQNNRELSQFLSSPRINILVVDRRTAEHYATLVASLRAAGTPIPTNDLWIAASAIQHTLALFTFDAHFKKVAGLRCGTTVLELSTP